MNEPPDEPSDSSSFSSPVQQSPPPPLPPGRPTLVLLSPSGSITFANRYPSILKKMQRDAILISVSTITELNRLLTRPKIVASVAGFVVTDGTIMDFDLENEHEGEDEREGEGGNQALARTLRSFLLLNQELSNPSPVDTNTSPSVIGNGTGNTRTKPWTILHAFDFPSYAARHPFRFSKYISSTFSLNWKICGATKEKIALEIGERSLRKMEGRVYRGGRYNLRGVFLECVKEGDKVLRVARGASVRNGGLGMGGQPDCLFDFEVEDGEVNKSAADKKDEGGEETDSTAGENVNYVVERVEIGESGGLWSSIAPARNDDDSASSLDWGEGAEIQVLEPEVRREEYEWADDELTGESRNDNDEEDSSSSSSSSSSNSDAELKPNETILYINAPNQRGNDANADSEASLDPPNIKNKTKKKRKKKKMKKKKIRPAQRIADCPVAIHEIKSLTERGQQVPVRGYVGFVGHIEDNRSMASLILGMCGVRNSRPLPESMRASLRGYLG
ncbi:hypothetical protein BDV12DRAFT_198311 [Aspergillus spectabilis]